ncbi:OTU-like cysteine protease domain-containing protein, putative [Eimeria mitis]|uniref:OTU-like cysteine protease domain-containing protein, putative n=1 Tax=Eimeria mitis TaxID=44415 RepID=U6JQ25_9EIME|nr:OTU-like cysteine protease domain-containing protein, putative [Eimeria mitis]CDJ26961.1 OTU-like cysteine protease domain-containing protein, putative [Eimeria mitis]
MIAADAQQHGDSPSCAVSVAAAHGTFLGLEGKESFRLGDDLEGTQVVRITCHCCKTTNTLICNRTQDGSWLLRHAAATATAITAPAVTSTAAGDHDDQSNTASFDTGGDLGEAPRGTADADSWDTDSGKERKQESSIKVTVCPAQDCKNQGRGDNFNEKQSNDVVSQASEPGPLRLGAQPTAAATTVVTGAAALAIAAPEPRRDAAKATRARSSNSSICESQYIRNEAVHESLTGVKEHDEQYNNYRDAQKKAHSDGEVSDGSPKLAAIKELQRNPPKPKHLPHVETESQDAEEGAQQCSPTCSNNSTDDSGSSSSNSRSSTKKAQQDAAIAAMAPYMLTRECEGDGNCLYRAFSDQLYGSQEHHLFLRRLAVYVMSRCKDTFEAFVDESEGPFERWLQTKRTYGEWADYREMHALLLLFGTPIFVFDERLQLLQAFEPDAEKRKPPSQEGDSLTPFRLMWHGKLGHYTSLHYIKEGFPIARGLTIGELEAEGLARLVLSVASEGSSDSAVTDAAAKSSFKEPAVTAVDVEEEALAECLQVSAQELAGIAAEQELILASIKKQRLQQVLPQTTRIVNELWFEAKKEQEAWTSRVARGLRGSPLATPAMDPPQYHSVLGRATERRLASPAVAASAAAVDSSTTSVHTYYPTGRGYAGSSSGVAGSAGSVPSARSGGPIGEVQQMGGHAGGLWRESRPSQTLRYDRPQQQMWREQLHLRQQATATALPPVVCHSQGPRGPVLISSPASPVGPTPVTPTAQGLPAFTTGRSFAYTHQFAPHNETVEQQRPCVRLADGRLLALAPSGAVGPVRHGTLQQQRQPGQQPQRLLPASAAAVNGQRQSSTRSSAGQTEEASWFMRWMGSGNSGQGRGLLETPLTPLVRMESFS